MILGGRCKRQRNTDEKGIRFTRMRNPTGLRWGSLLGLVPTIKTCVFAPQLSSTPGIRGDEKRGMGDKTRGIRGKWVGTDLW